MQTIDDAKMRYIKSMKELNDEYAGKFMAAAKIWEKIIDTLNAGIDSNE